jgi:hypothetical protein
MHMRGASCTWGPNAHAAALARARAQCAIGLDMRNVERKGAGEALHPFIACFRGGIGALLGHADLKKEMVGARARSEGLCGCV